VSLLRPLARAGGLNFPITFLLLLIVTGCKPEPPREPAIGEAYAGPGSLAIRKDIGQQSPVVATVNHGERLEILQRRRRFVKVRTARKVEGWTDDRMLLSPQEVASLRKLSEQSKSAPSQGVATGYEALNVHTEPDRQSPSFLTVKEGEKVDVIGRRVTPRNSLSPPKPPPSPSPPKARKKKKSSKESKKDKQVPPPPLPAAPKPPPDWMELSKTGQEPAAPAAVIEAPPVPMDDWSLIRNKAGQTGWVLTRRLVMAIPDEVAQYAEGRRISSYFPLGETRDGQTVKQSWLWTTVERGLEPHDFDSFRVFIWSLRRHRYETAHIERNLKGFFPVLTQPVAAPRARGAANSGEKVPGFSILVEKKDGLRYRRSYAFLGNLVRFSGEERVDTPASMAAAPGAPAAAPAEIAPHAQDSLFSRMKQRFHDWGQRLFGR
jgi:hypothetical protein